jgi:tetratricopeptide (TPR) repeat protein
MIKSIGCVSIGVVLLLVLSGLAPGLFQLVNGDDTAPLPVSSSDSYTGSISCRKCHEKFYQLWAPSHHGLAMQPYTREFARKYLTAQPNDVTIGDYRYRADISEDTGHVIEQGPTGRRAYPIDHVMGGKNVYYFLTTLERGRLQTLPVAYDVHKKAWFDMAASGVRHVPGHREEPIHWQEWQYTFNTACFGCHVSQVSTNYDLLTDTYRTVWKEPGINCETCHGPAQEHVRVCEETPKGTVPKDLKITRGGRDFTPDQNNANCSGCHAKAQVLTTEFKPGDTFFDHYGLVTLEHPDYYPDGRDLGENYTYTSWIMSPCVKSGKLDCMHCHTSSGRYRFKAKDKANQACMPCHQDKVSNPTAHTHHKADSKANQCIACHMPMTEFARMRRTDHSMLPPTPSGTIAYASPNACNLCHTDRDAAWADTHVRKWRTRDFQAPVLHRASLIDAARKRDWSRLPEMLDYVTSKGRDEVFATSLIRLVQASEDPRTVPMLFAAIKDPSPQVRSAAAVAMQTVRTKEAVEALVAATQDSCRLVRVRAAASLAPYKEYPFSDADWKALKAANDEYLASIVARPDQWESHYNMGNYHLDRNELSQAVASYEIALQRDPRAVLAMINKGMAHARAGDPKQAGESFQKALEVSPDNAAAHFNLGLLKAEQSDFQAAEEHLKAAFKADPQMAQAAYNLSVLVAKDRIDEALDYCAKAAKLRPDNPRYAYSLSVYQLQKGDVDSAIRGLENLIARSPSYADTYPLLGAAYESQGKKEDAERVYDKGLKEEAIPAPYKIRMKMRSNALKSLNTE